MFTRLSTIKNPQQEFELFSRRTITLAIIVCILVFALIIRLFWLQIFQHKTYMTLSRLNQFNLVPIEPNRGLIFDRHGQLLAENIPSFSLAIVLERVTNLQNTLIELNKIIPISQEDLRHFHRAMKQKHRFEPTPLRLRLTEEEVARFSVDQYRFPGVIIKAQLIRHYPLGATMVHALGYVGRINEKELEQVDETNYSATNYIGKLGIEKYYESQLHGNVGYEQIETDASGREVRVLKKTLPTPGANLYLSLDSHLQQAAINALAGMRGAAVAIDPNNGQVLALVSNPNYDPNLFVTGINPKDFHALRESPDQPLYNRALRGQYPPGSTIKPFIGLAGLVTGTVTPSTSIYDPGYFMLPNSTHLYRDWKKEGHGTVDIKSAIPQSCDTYFFTLASKLGITRIDEILSQFGFGKLTSIDIAEELPGLLPTPTWKRAAHGHAWYPGDTLITGIGQGFMLATPLQLAHAAATIAMRGRSYQPHLVTHIQTANGQIKEQLPIATPSIPITDKNIWDLILMAMKNVVQSPIGTGYRFGANAPYTMAGKSGTVQVFTIKQNERYNAKILPERLRDHSLFIAFAPFEHPKIAVAVIVENGTVPAGSIARKILDAYLLEEKTPQVTTSTPTTVKVLH